MRHAVATGLLWAVLVVWAVVMLVISMAALILYGIMFVLGGKQ